MDYVGATMAAQKLATNMSLSSSAPFLTDKAKWDIQIRGAYHLVYPLIHVDYPTREETMAYVADRIREALMNHNSVNRHNGAFSTPGINVPVIPTFMGKDPTELTIIKKYINNSLSEVFKIDVKAPVKPQDQKFSVIGYGV